MFTAIIYENISLEHNNQQYLDSKTNSLGFENSHNKNELHIKIGLEANQKAHSILRIAIV